MSQDFTSKYLKYKNKYKKLIQMKGRGINDECIICMGTFEDDSLGIAKELICCGTVLHLDCLTQTKLTGDKCPHCRYSPIVLLSELVPGVHVTPYGDYGSLYEHYPIVNAYKRICANGMLLSQDDYNIYNDHYFIVLSAVKQNGLALQYASLNMHQNYFINNEAVKQNGLALQYVREQTEELCKFAVQQNGLALQYVREQTEELCKFALLQNWRAFQYIREKTAELRTFAYQQDWRAIFMSVGRNVNGEWVL